MEWRSARLRGGVYDVPPEWSFCGQACSWDACVGAVVERDQSKTLGWKSESMELEAWGQPAVLTILVDDHAQRMRVLNVRLLEYACRKRQEIIDVKSSSPKHCEPLSSCRLSADRELIGA